MPMTITLELPRTPLEGHSHPKRIATKCGHEIHPSASNRTPWCPACVASSARAKLDAAQKNLVAEGGLQSAECMRDRRWNQARLKHDIAKERLEKTRKESQLRWEREQAWDQAHRRHDAQCTQAAAALQDPTECSVCASMVTCYSYKVPKLEMAKNMTWWERRGGLAVEHTWVPRTPPRSRNQPRGHAYRGEGSQALRKVIQNLRRSMYAADAHRRIWDTRYRTESAVRRKHSLGEEFHREANFWDTPISGLISLRHFQQARDNQRMAARRARGNTLRPTPPRSSLSHFELSEDLEVNEDEVEAKRQEEEQVELEREARKVGEEVGYLYFVGGIDGMQEWKEDIVRSDRQLVYRTRAPNSESSGSEETDDDEEGLDEMEMDEP